jgi:hypothetical protein
MTNSRPWSRRTALKGTLALGALSPLGIWPKLSLAGDVPRPQLLMNIRDTPRLMSAQFDFVVDA